MIYELAMRVHTRLTAVGARDSASTQLIRDLRDEVIRLERPGAFECSVHGKVLQRCAQCFVEPTPAVGIKCGTHPEAPSVWACKTCLDETARIENAEQTTVAVYRAALRVAAPALADALDAAHAEMLR